MSNEGSVVVDRHTATSEEQLLGTLVSENVSGEIRQEQQASCKTRLEGEVQQEQLQGIAQGLIYVPLVLVAPEIFTDYKFDDPAQWVPSDPAKVIVSGGIAEFQYATFNRYLAPITPELIKAGTTYEVRLLMEFGSLTGIAPWVVAFSVGGTLPPPPYASISSSMTSAERLEIATVWAEGVQITAGADGTLANTCIACSGTSTGPGAGVGANFRSWSVRET